MVEQSAPCICGGTGCQVCKVEAPLRSAELQEMQRRAQLMHDWYLGAVADVHRLEAENERLRETLDRIADSSDDGTESGGPRWSAELHQECVRIAQEARRDAREGA